MRWQYQPEICMLISGKQEKPFYLANKSGRINTLRQPQP
jgi:hypothetical protein